MLHRKLRFDSGQMSAHRMGLIFTVHEVRGVEGNLIFALCSIRPSEKTQQEFGRSKWGMYRPLCDFQMGMIWNPKDGKSRDYVPWRMASMNPGPFDAEGICAEWVIMVPRGDWSSPLKTWNVGAQIYTRGPLAEKMQKDGKQYWAKFDQLGTVQIPEAPVSLDWVAKAVYDDAKALTTISSRVELWNASERSADGTLSSKAATVDTITQDQFLKQIRRAVKDATKPSDEAGPAK